MLCDVIIYPFIEFETIEGDALFTNRDFSEAWPYLSIEPVAIHTEVRGCVPQPQQTRQQDNRASVSRLHADAD